MHLLNIYFNNKICILNTVYKIIWLNTDLKCLIGEGTQSMKHNNNHNFKLYSTL